MACKNCSSIYERCPDVTTSNCVSYQGKSKDCVDICPGDSLTVVAENTADKVCDLLAATDMSSIVVQACLTAEMGIKPLTILNLIQSIINVECNLATQITTGLSGKIGYDDQITLDYPCCNKGCFSEYSDTLTGSRGHLQKIIHCLCTLNTYTGIGTSDSITNLTQEIINLQNTVVSLQLQLDRITCINDQLISILGPSGYITCF